MHSCFRKLILGGVLGSGLLFLLHHLRLQATDSDQWIAEKGSSQATYPVQAVAPAEPVLMGAGDIAECQPPAAMTANIIAKLSGTVFTTGDNAYPRGTAEEFQRCYEPTWGQFKERTFPSPGNHDYYSLDAAPYYAYFGKNAGPTGKGFYRYTLGEWHIVSLNSNIDAQRGSAQEQWLRTELTKQPKACILAYWHHPVFSSGIHGNDPKMKDIWQTLAEFGADVVVNGHDHHYERFAPQTADGKADAQRGIREFVVGTGGAGLRSVVTPQPNSEVINDVTHGVIQFTLRANAYDWEFLPIQGQTFRDKGTGTCVKS